MKMSVEMKMKMEMTKKAMRGRKWVSSDSRSLYERQRAIASAKVRGCIVNPPVVPKVEGIFTFLETGVDDLAARMMGYDDGRAVIEARANGHLKGLELGISVKIQPFVIFQPHPSYLNPTTQPLTTGKWLYLTPDDKATAHRYFAKYQQHSFTDHAAPTAEEIQELRRSGHADSRTKTAIRGINIAWAMLTHDNDLAPAFTQQDFSSIGTRNPELELPLPNTNPLEPPRQTQTGRANSAIPGNMSPFSDTSNTALYLEHNRWSPAAPVITVPLARLQFEEDSEDEESLSQNDSVSVHTPDALRRNRTLKAELAEALERHRTERRGQREQRK